MEKGNTDLSSYKKDPHVRGAGTLKVVLWIICSAIVFRTSWFHCPPLKKLLLRLFGAKLGRELVIKPSVNIKHPWKLVVGDHAWIGENVWLDNLDSIVIGDHVCLSQGATLITGNHDYSRSTFDLRTDTIVIEDGVWVGACAKVAPGVTLGTHCVVSMGAVILSDCESYGIYKGNPGVKHGERKIQR